MRAFIATIALAVFLFPGSTKADVVTSDDISRLTRDAQNLNNSCKLVDYALYTQGSMKEAPDSWRTLALPSSISFRYPWSSRWYLIGKQIPWYENRSGSYSFGRFQPAEACGVEREYRIDVYAKTIKQHFAVSADGPSIGTIIDQMTINGRPAALVNVGGGICEEEAIATEVMRNGKAYTVLLVHSCSKINSEMLRMAASIK
jgi:hypothetical protein